MHYRTVRYNYRSIFNDTTNSVLGTQFTMSQCKINTNGRIKYSSHIYLQTNNSIRYTRIRAHSNN